MKKFLPFFVTTLFVFPQLNAGLSDYLPSFFSSAEEKPATEEVEQQQEKFDPDPERDYPIAKQLVEEKNFDEAIQLIQHYYPIILTPSEEGKRWLELYINLTIEVKEVRALMSLYDLAPLTLQPYEEALVLVGKGFLLTKRGESYETLRESVNETMEQHDKWFLLDANYLVSKGLTDDAIKHLQSRTLEGELEIERLLQLATIQFQSSRKEAWENINQACTLNPKHLGARNIRARFLELVGKKELAKSEYISMTFIEPENVALKDLLGNFFLRYKEYPNALQVWGSTLEKESTATIWKKILFWSKVTHKVVFNWKEREIPEGHFKPLADYLIHLDEGLYWDEKKIEENPELSTYLRTDQSTFWLRLIQLLKDGNEEKALELVELNPFEGQLWDRDLYMAIKRVLHYRASETFGPQEEYKPSRESHIFYTTLHDAVKEEGESNVKFHLEENVKELLMSDEVFASTFLGAKWIEAALYLHKMPVIPESFPEWVTYGLTQSFRYNRGYLEALNFASKQNPFDTLNVLKAELLIATGSPDAAMETLKPYVESETDVGFRSAWIMSNLYLGQKKLEEAKEIVNTNSRLKESLQGKESLARIAIAENNSSQAQEIYGNILDKSSEAKAYFAKLAFQNEDWKEAKKLTIDLLRQHPNNIVLRQNLLQIIEKEKQSNE